MALKRCKTCNVDKTIYSFYKNTSSSDGYRHECKICTLKHKKEVRVVALDKFCSSCNIKIGKNSKHLLCKKCDYIINRDFYINKASSYFENNKNKVAQVRKNKYNTDINFRLKTILRSRLNTAIKKNSKSGSAVSDLGCSIEEFKKHIESLWQPGMTWENYGKGNKCWNIDHKSALANHDLTNREELKKACHYTNLQPMWEPENIKKGTKLWL